MVGCPAEAQEDGSERGDYALQLLRDGPEQRTPHVQACKAFAPHRGRAAAAARLDRLIQVPTDRRVVMVAETLEFRRLARCGFPTLT
eukprot:SAG31_NODE_10457_length_1136_cov_1.900675_3_plen_87_part_00